MVSIKDELRGTYKNIEEARSAALYTISRLGFRLVNTANYNAGKAMLSRRELIALIYTGRTLLGIRYPTSGIKSMYEQIKKAEKALEMRGFEISYQTEKDSMLMLEGGTNIMAIVPPPISKSEVRSLALSGEVFVHKSTRHVIPARPLNVNIPLDWLSGKYTIDEARRMLLEHLVKKSIKRLPPGTVL
ncbi:MAG: ABC transporter ATP-binding protein, partial [Desulfurococcaceae archaeon]